MTTTQEVSEGTSPLAVAAVARIERIGTLPEITARIIATAEDPRSTIDDLCQIISHDPALVSSVLKLVNSAFHARANRIESVGAAVVMLGLSAVKNLAIATGMGKLFGRTKLCDGYTARDLWDHCIGVAVTARELARTTNRRLADQAFLAGLLHDVGILAALQLHPDKVVEVCRASQSDDAPFWMIEQRCMGMDHQELGAALAARWGFPDVCQASAAYHHRPAEAPASLANLVALVHTADVLCCHGGIGFNLCSARRGIEEEAVRPHVPQSAIDQISQDLASMLWSAVTVFNG